MLGMSLQFVRRSNRRLEALCSSRGLPEAIHHVRDPLLHQWHVSHCNRVTGEVDRQQVLAQLDDVTRECGPGEERRQVEVEVHAAVTSESRGPPNVNQAEQILCRLFFPQTSESWFA